MQMYGLFCHFGDSSTIIYDKIVGIVQGERLWNEVFFLFLAHGPKDHLSILRISSAFYLRQ